MVRRRIGLGSVCVGLWGTPALVHAASGTAPPSSERAEPADRPAPRKTASSGTSKASGSSSSATQAAALPVVPLPEELVRAEGLRFDGTGGIQLSLPSREALRLPGGFA